jgi:hypothetical protein
MLEREEVERALRLHACGYGLLQWLEGAITAGFIAPATAHEFGTVEESARAWLERHYLNLPPEARPPREELPALARLFGTYLRSTFDLEPQPRERLYSPDAHCFCPGCSWLVRVPHLRPKRPSPADKALAAQMRRQCLDTLACELEILVSDEQLTELLDHIELREAIGLCSYAHDLLRRLEGIAVGPASLVLWRSFAWTALGSPKQDFVLSADDVMSAEQHLRDQLGALGC